MLLATESREVLRNGVLVVMVGSNSLRSAAAWSSEPFLPDVSAATTVEVDEAVAAVAFGAFRLRPRIFFHTRLIHNAPTP